MKRSSLIASEPLGRPDAYELQAIRDIKEWRDQPPPKALQIIAAPGKPIEWALAPVLKSKPAQGAINGAASVLTKAGAATLDIDTILDAIRAEGAAVGSVADLTHVPLRSHDARVGGLGKRYVIGGAGLGGPLGALGLPGAVADVPALMTLTARAICEFAVNYGFDPRGPRERPFVVNIVAVATAGTVKDKQAALGQVALLAQQLARGATWADLEKIFGVTAIRELAKRLGIRITKAKLAAIVPVLGALVGGAYNGVHMGAVSQTAFMEYRARHLTRRYGEGIWLNS